MWDIMSFFSLEKKNILTYNMGSIEIRLQFIDVMLLLNFTRREIGISTLILSIKFLMNLFNSFWVWSKWNFCNHCVENPIELWGENIDVLLFGLEEWSSTFPSQHDFDTLHRPYVTDELYVLLGFIWSSFRDKRLYFFFILSLLFVTKDEEKIKHNN